MGCGGDNFNSIQLFNGMGASSYLYTEKKSVQFTHLRKLGCPEVMMNSLKHKGEGKTSAAFGIKRPRWSEVNYCPSLLENLMHALKVQSGTYLRC